jgi:hypothetical protein
MKQEHDPEIGPEFLGWCPVMLLAGGFVQAILRGLMAM